MLKSNLLLWQRHIVHYLIHCPILSDEQSIFLNNIRSIDENILSGSDSRISETLLFGISSFNDAKNTSILNSAIDYILSTKRSDVPLTSSWFVLKHLCIEDISFNFDVYMLNRLLSSYLIYYWFRHAAFTTKFLAYILLV